MNAASFYLSASSGDRPVVGSTSAVDLISSSTIIEPAMTFATTTSEGLVPYPAATFYVNAACLSVEKLSTSPSMRTTDVNVVAPFTWR